MSPAASIVHPPKTFGPATADPSALLERERELDVLAQLVAATVAGRGAAAFVTGPAGIGKTSLLRAAADLASAAGMEVLSARGGEMEQEFAHGIVRQLFEPAVRALEPTARARMLCGAAAATAPIVDPTSALPPGPAAAPFTVLHGLYWLCANLAARRPVLLAVDDAHWCDESSLRFLAYLQRRLEGLRVLLVSAARPASATVTAELLERVMDDPAVVRLTPSPLSIDAVGAIVPAGAEPGFVAAYHRSTGGNPFLCGVLTSALTAEGLEATDAHAERVTELAAHAVSREVVRRMGAGPSASPGAGPALARALALLGTRGELRQAAALAGLDERTAARAADALAEQGLLRAGERPEFVHPLLQAAVLETIPVAERGLAHAAAARILLEAGGRPEQVAVHLLLAPPGRRDPQVVETLRVAARTVAAQGDPATAARCLRRAAAEPPDAGIRPSVLHELGVAELLAGPPIDAERHLREALALCPHGDPLRAEVGRDLALALRIARRYPESVAVMEAVIAEVAGRDPDRALGLTGELHQTAMMHPATYRALAGRFDNVERARGAATPGERAMSAALATEACLRTTGRTTIHARAVAAVQHGLVDEDDPHSGLWANVAFPLIFAEGFELAERMCDVALRRARELGSPTAVARAHLVAGMLSLRVGSVREAMAHARTAIDIGREVASHPWLMAVDVLLEALVERGELDTGEAVLEETGMTAEVPDLFLATWVLLGRAALRIAEGRTAQAIEDLEEIGRRGREGWQPWNPGMFPYRSMLALVLLRRGDAAGARALADEELELARRWGGARAIGVALRARGMASGTIEDLREAVRILAPSGAALEHARAQVELGAAIARTGRRIEAREPLRTGLDVAHRCGATVLAARAREEAHAAGARPRRAALSGVEALTSSELRIAHMAADGMTNREIAQALFVTLRTVQVHLTHTYQKLGIRSREQLPDALSR